MDANSNHTTQPPSDESQFKPQTYEEWKAAHGWQPQTESRLEIGQRVKAVEFVSGWGDELDVIEDLLGTITHQNEAEPHLYTVKFDNGRECNFSWFHDSDWGEIEIVGMSPSEQARQLAHEQSERERLAAYQQLSLFDAAQTGGAE